LASRTLTLLLDPFVALISALDANRRFTALESLLGRGRTSNHDRCSGDLLRFHLFGYETGAPLPVAALTRLSDGPGEKEDERYLLRLDPVTLWADLARVIMSRCGFADLDELERNEVENTVRAVLFREGFDLQSDHPERWTIALDRPLEFGFASLEEALGRDMAEVLPDHPAALHWRRLMNEIQMALHACPVNERRRRQGKIEINSVWFWGGGFLPPALPEQTHKTVFSDHPVTRGLAILHDCVLHGLSDVENADFENVEKDVLVDWSRRITDPQREMELLESLAGRLLEAVRSSALSVYLCTPQGRGWLFDRRSIRLWWKRRLPLAHYAGSNKP